MDQTAPYYRHDGYWNGAVWMPHQWFLWKTMLDLGQADFAFKIAQTALDLWKAEVDESYDCFEHFLIDSGRGAGWHQFSALSSPVLAWFSAYYRPGRLTAGFDTWVHRCDFKPDHYGLDAELELRGRSAAEATILVTLQPGPLYRAQWNGKLAPTRTAPSGTLQIALPRDSGRGRLASGSCAGLSTGLAELDLVKANPAFYLRRRQAMGPKRPNPPARTRRVRESNTG